MITAIYLYSTLNGWPPADHYLKWLGPDTSGLFACLVYDMTGTQCYGVTWQNTMVPLREAGREPAGDPR